jgi:hypothetical protein
MVVFPAQSPDLRRSPLVARVRGQLSASPGSRRLISIAPHDLEGVLPVRRVAVSAPRFFQRRPRDRTGLPASSPCGSLEVTATSSLQDFHPFITSMLGTQRSRSAAAAMRCSGRSALARCCTDDRRSSLPIVTGHPDRDAFRAGSTLDDRVRRRKGARSWEHCESGWRSICDCAV